MAGRRSRAWREMSMFHASGHAHGKGQAQRRGVPIRSWKPGSLASGAMGPKPHEAAHILRAVHDGKLHKARSDHGIAGDEFGQLFFGKILGALAGACGMTMIADFRG